MGISGLLPFLEKSSKKCRLSEFKGSTVAVDSYCLLHRGAFGCAEKLVRGEPTDGYVLYCLKFVKMLLDFQIRPIMVFDGQHLPAKAETEKKRREQRKAAKKQAAELLRLGNISEYRRVVTKVVDITHSMALKLIQECRRMNIDCIVAPYEADAQMAYLSINKIVDIVVTEDSDLVLFGCSKILFKLDLSAEGILIDSDKLYLSMQMSPDKFTFDKFRYMCIISGCDYIPSLPGIGLKKAQKFIKLTAETNVSKFLPKLPSYLNMRQLNITDEYMRQFMIADATFKHQIVYDPIRRKLVPLTDPESCGTDQQYCCNAGKMFDEQLAFQLAIGNIDPFTHEKLDDWSPDKRKSANENTNSIWSRFYTKPEPNKSVTIFKKQIKSPEIHRKQIIIAEKALEDEKEKADIQLQKELQMYLKPCCSKENEKTLEATVENKRMSPVLNRSCNPFLKKGFMKKISKFNRTSLDETIVVKSRFFHVNTENSLNVPMLAAIDNYTEETKSSHSEIKNVSQSEESNLNKSDSENLSEPVAGNLTSRFQSRKPMKCPQNEQQKKNINRSKNQPTLLTMFNNMKK